MIEIKDKEPFIRAFQIDLAKADPNNDGFTNEDRIFYEKDGGIYTCREYGDSMYCVCVISLGKNFMKGFISFVLFTLKRYNEAEIICNKNTSVERYLKKHDYIFIKKLDDKRLLYYKKWRF